MRGTKWSSADRQKAWRLRCTGKTLEEIGQELGRSVGSVNTCLQAMRHASAAKKRPCLCCGKTFHSAGPHNRLCISCARRSISPYTP